MGACDGVHRFAHFLSGPFLQYAVAHQPYPIG